MEREQSYKDAADHYEKAWKHESRQSAQVSKHIEHVEGGKRACCFCKRRREQAIQVWPNDSGIIVGKSRQGSCFFCIVFCCWHDMYSAFLHRFV